MTPDAAPDLYLPPSSRPLYHAVASALQRGHPATVAYLADYAPIPDQVAAQLRERFPQIELTVRRDSDAMADMATLPCWVPAIVRRNWAPRRGAWLAGPAQSAPSWLAPRYRDAIIYTTGHFTPKTLRHRCDRIILREEGLGNYHSLPFSPGKALVRALWGRSPRSHFMGEEPWVDLIQLSAPQHLPARLQAKAQRFGVESVLASLPEATRTQLAQALWSGPMPPSSPRSALIVSQPLDLLGFCSAAEKRALYGRIAASLRREGYEPILKPHPQDSRADAAAIAGDSEMPVMPAFFPIEAWPDLTRGRFEVAVALCSAALAGAEAGFCRHALQLVDPVSFGRRDLSGWDAALARGLSGLRGAAP